jgi:urease accessory protein
MRDRQCRLVTEPTAEHGNTWVAAEPLRVPSCAVAGVSPGEPLRVPPCAVAGVSPGKPQGGATYTVAGILVTPNTGQEAAMSAHRYRILLALPLLIPALACAHITGTDLNGGFLVGFLHPLGGIDHVAAMVAVGMWGAQLGAPSLWALPVAFPLIMALGGAAGAAGLPLPGVETGIACSGLLLGLAVLGNVRVPPAVALVPVGVFAVYHGFAHGAEMPVQSQPLLYASGFVLATGMLHLCGIAIGLLWRWPAGQWVVRASGGVVAGVGGFLLFS